jgi:peptidoglycan/LPS O-acetylase OafA/YrhL
VHQRIDIQGLRAIAVILVIAFHYDLGLPLGYLGVDMFFVISGYVISLSTIRNIRSEKRFNWQYFYRRRVRRLLPGAAIVATLSSLFALLALSPFGPQQKTATMLMSVATYSTNFALMKSNYYALDSSSNPLLHFWSLAVEEQFYFLWGPVVLAAVVINARRNRLSTRVALMIFGALVAVISLTLFVLMSRYETTVMSWPGFKGLAQDGFSPSSIAFYSPVTRGWEFMAGVGIALVDSRTLKKNSQTALVHCITMLGLALIVLGISNFFGFWDSSTSQAQGLSPWAVISTVFGTSALLWAGNRRAFTNSLLASRPLTYMGDISYTLYLWHWPIWVFGITIYGKNNWVVSIGLLLTLLFSAVQYHFVEDPFRKGHLYPQGTVTKLVVPFLVVASMLMVGLNFSASKIGAKLIGTTPEQLIRHVTDEPCPAQRVTFGEASTCRYRPKKVDGLIILVGDSTAKSLSDGFITAAHNLGLEAMVFHDPGCPFQVGDSPFNLFCQSGNKRNNDIWSAIRILRPVAVVVSNLNYLYVRDIGLPDLPIGPTRVAWANETHKIFKQLQNLNIEGLLVQPVPEFASDVRYEVTILRQNVLGEDRSVLNSGNEFLNEMDTNAVMKVFDDRSILNFYRQFCTSDLCSQVKAGKFMYEDGSHLSSVGSMVVAPEVEQALRLLIQN